MDENTCKSIIQDYEDLLLLVETVKNDVPQIKKFQQDVTSQIKTGKREISESVEIEKNKLESILLSSIAEIQKAEKKSIDMIDDSILSKASVAIEDLKKCELGLKTAEKKVDELTERIDKSLEKVEMATNTLTTALNDLKSFSKLNPDIQKKSHINIDYDQQLPLSEIYEKYHGLNIPIIIQKTTWDNDYCAYVFEYNKDKGSAYGRIYLDGKVYRERNYISASTICKMYDSPNKSMILNNESLLNSDSVELEIGDTFDVNIKTGSNVNGQSVLTLTESKFEYDEDADESIVFLQFELENRALANKKYLNESNFYTKAVTLVDDDDDEETVSDQGNFEDDLFDEYISYEPSSIVYELRIYEDRFDKTSLVNWKNLTVFLNIGDQSYRIEILEIEEDDDEDDDEPVKFTDEEVLYVYQGNIVCHRYHHTLINVTGILHNKEGNEIEIEAEYCIDCGKYLISYDSYLEYRRRYGGILLGNIQMTSSGEFNSEYDLAEESPLRLSGYTVNAQDNYSINERQFILATIIHDGIMSKHDVTRYLEYFLRVNGQKRNMGLAVRKWKEDLEFAKKYNSSTQPKVYLNGVKRYTR